MSAPLSEDRLAEIRASVAAAAHPAPGTWALALRELLAELDRRSALLRSVQEIAWKRRAEAKGREAYGKRLKAENAALTEQLHGARKTLRTVEQLLSERTPFSPRLMADGYERTVRWLLGDRDAYRSRVDTAEGYARRTEARISALLLEPEDPQGCAVCGLVEEGHAVQVTDDFPHTWKRPMDELVRQRVAMRREMDRWAAGEPSESELGWLRARVMALESERAATNAAVAAGDEQREQLLKRIAALEAQRTALAARLRAGQRWERGRVPARVSEDFVSQSELRSIFGIPLTAPWDEEERLALGPTPDGEHFAAVHHDYRTGRDLPDPDTQFPLPGIAHPNTTTGGTT